jgi:hypothetical protein
MSRGFKENVMTISVSRLCLAAALLALAGCAADIPPDHEATYSYYPVPSPTARHPDRVRYVLAPDSCQLPDPTAAVPTGPYIPAGCANDHNLLRMTERQQDLVKGRPLGRAPAAPTARAAQRYINGGDSPLGASAGKPGGATPATTDEESAQTPGAPAPSQGKPSQK